MGERTATTIDNTRTLLEALIENSQAAIYVKDLDGHFLINNETSARLLGSTPESLRGRTDRDVMPHDLAARLREHDLEIMASRQRVEFDETILVGDELRTFVSVKFPVYDDAGELFGIGGISTDITDRKRTEQALMDRERLGSALNGINELLYSAFQDPESIQRAIELAGKAIGADFAGVLMIEDGTMVVAHEHGLGHPFAGTRLSDAEARMAYEVARSKRALFAENHDASPDYQSDFVVKRLGAKASAEVPLVMAGSVEGVAGLHFSETHRFTDAERDFVRGVGASLSMAFENMRLHEAEVQAKESAQRELATTEMLLDAAAALAQWTDVAQVLDTLTQTLLRTTGHTRVWVLLWDEGRREATLAAAGGVDAKQPGLKFEFDEVSRQTQSAVLTHQTTIVDYDALPPEERGLADALQSRLAILVPLTQRDRLVGFIRIDDPGERRDFSQRDIDLVEGIAAQAAVSIENARLYEAEVRDREQLDRALEDLRRTAAEARDRAALLDSVITSMTDGVIVYRPDGTVLRMNEQSRRMFGYTAADYDKSVPERWSRFVVSDERGLVVTPGLLPPIRALGGEAVRGEILRVTAPDRPDFWVSVSAAPIRQDDRIIGAVATYLDITSQQELRGRQESLVAELADANRELGAISQVTDAAIGTLDLGRLLDVVLDRLIQVLDADGGAVLLKEGDNLVTRSAHGLNPERRIGFEVPFGEGFAGWIAANRRPRYVADAQENPLVSNPVLKRAGVRSMLGVPLEVAGELIGVLHVDWTTIHPDDPRELSILQLSADRTALAIKNSQLFAERQEAARLSAGLNEIDTEINRRLEFDAIMQVVVERSARIVGADCAVIFLSEKGGWRSRYGWNVPERLMDQWFPPERVPYTVLAQRQPGLVAMDNDVARRRDYASLFVGQVGAGAVLHVALLVSPDEVADVALFLKAPHAHFTSLHADFMRNVAASLLLAMRNARMYADERQVADTLQRALLQTPGHVADIEFECLYRSATEIASVGGDFYDLFELHEHRVGVLIGDVSGKGLAASTLTSLVRNTVRAYAYDLDSPAGVVRKTNQVVFDAVPSDMFMTLLFGILDTSSGDFLYCNAGHPPGLLLRRNGGSSLLQPTGPLIGAFRDLDFRDAQDTLEHGEVLLLYTDGVTESRRGKEMFGEERLVQTALDEWEPGSPCELPQRIMNRLREFTGGPSADDIAMLSLALSPDHG